jgi:hypothetical protein
LNGQVSDRQKIDRVLNGNRDGKGVIGRGQIVRDQESQTGIATRRGRFSEQKRPKKKE